MFGATQPFGGGGFGATGGGLFGVYTMDVKFPLLVVGCAERHVLVYNLQAIQQNPNPYKQGQTALKMQTRAISCFPDKTGYAVGSIEGRCSIAYIEDTSKNFAFKCHRTNTEIYAVNDIDFHPQMGRLFCN
eukprot:g591.t1